MKSRFEETLIHDIVTLFHFSGTNGETHLKQFHFSRVPLTGWVVQRLSIYPILEGLSKDSWQARWIWQPELGLNCSLFGTTISRFQMASTELKVNPPMVATCERTWTIMHKEANSLNSQTINSDKHENSLRFSLRSDLHSLFCYLRPQHTGSPNHLLQTPNT